MLSSGKKQAAEETSSCWKTAMKSMLAAILVLGLIISINIQAANAKTSDEASISPKLVDTLWKNEKGSYLKFESKDSRGLFSGYFINCATQDNGQPYPCYGAEDKAQVTAVIDKWGVVNFIANFQQSPTICANSATQWRGFLKDDGSMKAPWINTFATYQGVGYDSGKDIFNLLDHAPDKLDCDR